MSDFKSYAVAAIRAEDEKIDSALTERFISLLENKDPFPIPLEVLVECEVYSGSKEAKRGLERAGFVEGQEFRADRPKNPEGQRGRPKTIIMLSSECFKSLCMLAQNDKGKQARSYYLIIERLWKRYMEAEFKAKDDALRDKDDQIETQQHELETTTAQLKHLDTIHQQTLYKRRRYQHRSGPCLYLAAIDKNTTKPGHSSNLTERAIYYKTAWGEPRIVHVFYTSKNLLLEECLLSKYESKRELNSEVIKDTPISEIIETCRRLLQELNLSFEEESNFDEQYGHLMGQYRADESEIDGRLAKFVENVSSPTKTCPCCNESKPRSEFGKDKNRPDGLACYCRPCKREKSKSYSKRDKIVLTEKTCKKCEETLPIDAFHDKADTADGKQSYCSECVRHAKEESKARAKGQYKCPKCDSIFDLKDSVKRHWEVNHPEEAYDHREVKRLE